MRKKEEVMFEMLLAPSGDISMRGKGMIVSEWLQCTAGHARDHNILIRQHGNIGFE